MKHTNESTIQTGTNHHKIINTDQFYRSLFEHNPEIVFFMDTEGVIAKANRVFSETLGYANDELVLSSWERFLPASEIPLFQGLFQKVLTGETQNVDTLFPHVHGHSIQVNLTLMPAFNNGHVFGIFCIAKDITERKKAEDLNRYFAYHDSLTGLPNNRFFQVKVDQALLKCQSSQQKLAVMYLDIDRFEHINHSLGTAIGDQLLEQISKRLMNEIDNKNTLARINGDEFAVLFPEIENPDKVIDYAMSIIKLLENPFFVADYHLHITTSIGISIYPEDGGNSHTLMKHARSALYKAKKSGKNTVQIFRSPMHAHAYKSFILESDLHHAVEQNQLELYYQPKVSVTSNQIVGAEALIRWNHPERGLLSPAEFIPLAEESGLILKMGKWVKRTACMQNKTWQNACLPAIPISINLSARRFLQKDLIKSIAGILQETNLNPQDLEIEITESSLLENERVVFSILDEIKRMGIKISLDDFGTGYSSLSYLNRFKGKIDTIKIDRLFIKDLGSNPDNTNFITKTIIQLAQHLNMNVVAEGVETEEQLNILREYKCDIIQGYYFSKPVPADEFVELLKQ